MFLVPLVVFLGVKFGFQKSCLCKRNDKYKVCSYLSQISQIIFVEKKLSCGEILEKIEKFWEILPQFRHFHVEKN